MGIAEFGKHLKDISKSVSREAGNALMQSSFEHMGDALTNTGDVAKDRATYEGRVQPWRDAGARAAMRLEERWHKAEFETFEKNQLSAYQQQLKGVLTEYQDRVSALDTGKVYEADGTTSKLDLNKPEDLDRALRYRQELERDFYMKIMDTQVALNNEAAKYPNNPIVGQMMSNLMVSQSELLANMQGGAQAAVENERTIASIRFMDRQGKAMEAGAGARGGKDRRNLQQIWEEEGPAGVRGYMFGPGGIALLKSEAGKRAYAEAEADIIENIKRTVPGIETRPSELESRKASNSMNIQNLALGKLVEGALGPESAAMMQNFIPEWFPSPPSDSPRELGNKGRVTPAREKQLLEAWKQKARDQVQHIINNSEEPITPEQAVEMVATMWLPRAIVGETDDVSLDAIGFVHNQLTASVRQKILTDVPKWLRRNWAGGESEPAQITRALFEKEAVFGRPAGSGRSAAIRRAAERKRGLLD